MSDRILKILLAVVVIAIAIHLGGHPLFDADEGRNAAVAREMAETNDYVMPRLNGLPYLDKPIVYFAAEAAVMELLGPTELAARLPAYLFTLATAAVIFFFARRAWGGETPWLAAILFLTMPLTIAFARTVIFDSALVFFTTVSLTTFYFAVEERNRRWSIAAWAAMGFAMITKGPVTFVLVLFVATPFAIWRKGARYLFSLGGLVLFAAIVAPWVWGVSQVVPEFLEYVLVTETAARMATDELKRTGPPWYFIPYLLAGAMPWSIVALFSWKRFRRPDPALVYWLLALAIPFLFFSLSQSKRPQYILPLMVPLALLIARVWDEARTRAAAIAFAILGALLFAGSFFAHRTKMRPELMQVADETAMAFGVVFVAGAIVALVAKRRELVLVALALPIVVLPAIATPAMRAIGERRSAKTFVEELTPHLTPSTHVIGIEAFSGSMTFYLRERMTVVTRDASELTSNYLIRRYEKFTRDPRSPVKPLSWLSQSLASSEPRVYVVRRQDVQWRRILEARGWRAVADAGHYVGYAK
ncbi:MAG TPA: glycosyltransferase family 39 protein [Thermoanaerobaculia bacterium]|nr:glycosyltransferase family 39 protein [Thermoanaerobaculia bacterium]